MLDALFILDITFQILPQLPWCTAGVQTIQTWLFAPGLNPLSLHRLTTSPLTGKPELTDSICWASLRSSCPCLIVFISERRRQTVTQQCHLIPPGSPSAFLGSALSSLTERVPLSFYLQELSQSCFNQCETNQSRLLQFLKMLRYKDVPTLLSFREKKSTLI